MSVVSKLTFVPFTSHDVESSVVPRAYRSNRNSFRGEVRGGLSIRFAAGIVGMGLPYSKEKYARIVVWCLGLLLDGWPADIPFKNLSDIEGGTATLRLLRDLLRNGTLKFIPAPPDVRQRALHDPESVLPHVMAAAKLPLLPLTIPILKFSESRFRDLISPPGRFPPLAHRSPASTHEHLPCPVPAPARELVLHPDTLEPLLTAPIGPDSSTQPRERRQRCDVNKARHRPISNPEGKPMRAQKVGALTSNFVLDRPACPSMAQGRVLKPLSELRLPVIVSDHLGGYSAPGGDHREDDEIESFSDSEDESLERRNRVKRRRYA